MLRFEAMLFFLSFKPVQLIWIYFIAGCSPTMTNSSYVCLLNSHYHSFIYVFCCYSLTSLSYRCGLFLVKSPLLHQNLRMPVQCTRQARAEGLYRQPGTPLTLLCMLTCHLINPRGTGSIGA